MRTVDMIFASVFAALSGTAFEQHHFAVAAVLSVGVITNLIDYAQRPR